MHPVKLSLQMRDVLIALMHHACRCLLLIPALPQFSLHVLLLLLKLQLLIQLLVQLLFAMLHCFGQLDIFPPQFMLLL